jgi:hypothetical protein
MREGEDGVRNDAHMPHRTDGAQKSSHGNVYTTLRYARIIAPREAAMHIDPIHAGQVALARTLVVGTHQTMSSDELSGGHSLHRTQRTPRCGPLERLVRWLKRPPVERGAGTHAPEPTTWTECVGRPYLVGAGTFLVMAYLRTMPPSLDHQGSDSTPARY